jgi:hypothetical protein
VTARFFRVKLFLDLDGVLADFDRGVIGLTGRHPREQSAREMWRAVVRAPDFFAALAFTDDGRRLWEFCRPLDPTILTGLPHGGWADPQKRRWVTEMLGPDVPVITCMARGKARYAAPGHVLVDDRESAREPWEAAGGVFIHHRGAEHTIEALKSVGVAPKSRHDGAGQMQYVRSGGKPLNPTEA